MNEQPKYKQLENLGIDIDLMNMILGRLDNMKLLVSYISSELENISDIEDLSRYSDITLLDTIKRVVQLTYIFDNEFKEANKSAELLNKQMNF